MRSEKWFFVLFVALYAATCAIVANAEPATVRFQNPGTATYAALRTKWGTVPVSCEATHALQWPVAGKAEHDRHHHPPAFWAQYGEIRDRFDHDGGHEDAGEFGWE